MKSIKYHPGKLISIWNDLPVIGKNMETGEWITFPYGHIIWELEGVVNDCIPVYFLNDGVSKEIAIYKDSMRLILSDDSSEMTPLQKLALSALPLSDWEPEEDN